MAISEFSETIVSNIKILKTANPKVVKPEIIQKLNDHFEPVMASLKALNKKGQDQPTIPNVKKVLRSIVENNKEMDDTMDQVFKMSNALFAISANYIVTRSLLRHPEEYAKLIENSDPKSARFKKEGSVETMKAYLFQDFEGKNVTVTRDASKSVVEALKSSSSDSSSDSAKDSSNDLSTSEHSSTSSSTTDDDSDVPASKEKVKKSVKGKKTDKKTAAAEAQEPSKSVSSSPKRKKKAVADDEITAKKRKVQPTTSQSKAQKHRKDHTPEPQQVNSKKKKGKNPKVFWNSLTKIKGNT